MDCVNLGAVWLDLQTIVNHDIEYLFTVDNSNDCSQGIATRIDTIRSALLCVCSITTLTTQQQVFIAAALWTYRRSLRSIAAPVGVAAAQGLVYC